MRAFSSGGVTYEQMSFSILGWTLADLGLRDGRSVVYKVCKKNSVGRRLGLFVSIDGKYPQPVVALEHTSVCDFTRQVQQFSLPRGSNELELHHIESAEGQTKRVRLADADPLMTLRDAGAADGSIIHVRDAAVAGHTERIERAVALLSSVQNDTDDSIAVRTCVAVRYLGGTHGIPCGIRSLDAQQLALKIRQVLGGTEDGAADIVKRLVAAHTRGDSLASSFTA